jgi:uncharacterized protein (DUF1697 family)
MGRYVALLRGVNVGGHKRVPMAEWRALLGTLGCSEVQTLLNSGNAVFSSRIRSTATLAQRIRESIQRGLKVDVPVIVKSAEEFAAIEADNNLANEPVDASRLLVAIAAAAKDLEPLAGLQDLVQAPEKFWLGTQALYLWCPDGILQSRAAEALLGKRGQALTTRNWGTVTKIGALLREPGD